MRRTDVQITEHGSKLTTRWLAHDGKTLRVEIGSCLGTVVDDVSGRNIIALAINPPRPVTTAAAGVDRDWGHVYQQVLACEHFLAGKAFASEYPGAPVPALPLLDVAAARAGASAHSGGSTAAGPNQHGGGPTRAGPPPHGGSGPSGATRGPRVTPPPRPQSAAGGTAPMERSQGRMGRLSALSPERRVMLVISLVGIALLVKAVFAFASVLIVLGAALLLIYFVKRYR